MLPAAGKSMEKKYTFSLDELFHDLHAFVLLQPEPILTDIPALDHFHDDILGADIIIGGGGVCVKLRSWSTAVPEKPHYCNFIRSGIMLRTWLWVRLTGDELGTIRSRGFEHSVELFLAQLLQLDDIIFMLID